MTSAAALLPPPPRPPHDPLWQALNCGSGWRLLASGGLSITVGAGDLAITPLPGSAPVAGDPNGSLGGMVWPGTMALDGSGNLWLLDRTRNRLRWFDRCLCRFVDARCPGLALRDPRGLWADHGRLYVADAGPPGRVLVLEARSLVVRAVWQPPRSAQPTAWQPTAVAVAGSTLLVADAANGALHRFALWGGYLGTWVGLGAISRLAVDCDGLLYLVRPGVDSAEVRDRDGHVVKTVGDPAALGNRFPDLPATVDRSGAIDLTDWCAGAGWFDLNGEPTPPPNPPAAPFPSLAVAFAGPLDSRIARCQWHRILRAAFLPPHGAIGIATTTAEIELPDQVVTALPDIAWTDVPLGHAGDSEALILSPPGRFLWLRLVFTGDGAASPLLSALDIEYPRISLRRHLPAAFGANPLAGEFADRFLAVFDRGFRDIEARIDDQAALFDSRSTPSGLLPWLAGWIGVVLDKRWPEARRRAYLRAAARLFACRGTWHGLRAAVLLWLGWSRLDGLLQPPARCAPPCGAPLRCPPLPLLVLEHWKLRRWLFLGRGRLGDAAELWGAALMNRSRLDHTARVGGTRLDVVKDPLRDPFHGSAHIASLFVPAHAVATPPALGALQRLLADQVPAHVRCDVVPVHPRMRVGIQASIGFDAVVGCWPSGIALGAATLGRGTVLPGAVDGPPLPPRIGRDARLRKSDSHPAPNREATP